MRKIFRKRFKLPCLSVSSQDAALERDVEFWISVCCEFEVEEQLVSLIKILKYLMALPQDKEDGEELNRPAMRFSLL